MLNEAFGFVLRCAVQSTAHLTDYVITQGTAVAMAGQSRATELIGMALAAGYFTETLTLADGRTAYKLVDDDTFLHMRTREEIDWERQRKEDNKNPALTIPARLRDGDACRYCGLVVNFHGNRRGQKGGTYDHLVRKPQGPDDIVVACNACNATLLDAPRSHREAEMMPVPPRPYFKPKTLEWLRDHEYVHMHNLPVPTQREPDVAAGRVPPGREKGAPATRWDGPEIPAGHEDDSRPVRPSTTVEHGPADIAPTPGPLSGPQGIPTPVGGPADSGPGTDPVTTTGAGGNQPPRPARTGSQPARAMVATPVPRTVRPATPRVADGPASMQADAPGLCGPASTEVRGPADASDDQPATTPAGSQPGDVGAEVTRTVRPSTTVEHGPAGDEQRRHKPRSEGPARSDLKRVDRQRGGSGVSGTGRDGSGRVGKGREAAPAGRTASAKRRARRRGR
ncbi:hypothetical protein NQ036_06870 [Brevibacterium sp. 91QC2O2]|uniref:HNH endonuclease n=1 Tax=Brevibacterium sp. 91QC2O2 TaxID=2968458 RepID=UPI00211B7847|nr:hypothetical protein [Brevibacterium sp. 91QC2O2]MCQ9367966.1 hypothetical protein [Brevibacterium sp. 91QC2O2]